MKLKWTKCGVLAVLISVCSVQAASLPSPSGVVPNRPVTKPLFHHNGTSSENIGRGIYSHQIYSALSADGLNWTKEERLIFDHASVPEAVITADGRIYLYFMDASEGHAMSVAMSSDLGQTWKKSTVEIADRQTSGHAVDPNVILLADGTFRLFYLGTFGPPQFGQLQESHICSALSKDGIHFIEENGFRFTKRGMITDPDVVKTSSGWMMFVSEGRKNLVTSSSDGMTFVEIGNPASLSGAVSKTIAMGGGWRMYRCGQGIESQFTRDFKIWIQEGVRVHLDSGKMMCDPSVIRLPDGTYKMFYKTAPAKF